ncbi:hypothetical protein [Terasakiella sp.]|uniref:hypothetical protein n=1 Tax=Terasakiella sp. TaxID=2034861 RepID=UPI003AA8972B
MRKLPKKELKDLFRSKVAKVGATCGKDNPFILNKGDFKCYVFIKNISSAYYKNYPDITRVQLPASERFKAVNSSDLLFIILGYDADNEVFVSWNPYKVKERLNTKQNVSIFSRLSLQSEVKKNEFKEGYLSNGEKIILFKKDCLNDFFEQLGSFFEFSQISAKNNSLPKKDVKEDISIDITEMKLMIQPLLEEHKVLQAVSLLVDKFNNHPTYKELKFKDWFEIVNAQYENLN